MICFSPQGSRRVYTAAALFIGASTSFYGFPRFSDKRREAYFSSLSPFSGPLLSNVINMSMMLNFHAEILKEVRFFLRPVENL